MTMVIGQRERIIIQTDGEKRKTANGASDDEDEDEEANIRRLQNVSSEALAKFEDFRECAILTITLLRPIYMNLICTCSLR